jgi:hypothetical protein
MYATATQPRTGHVQHESTRLRDSHPPDAKPTAAIITAVFMEQQGAGRLEELAETLDFPLDFQI